MVWSGPSVVLNLCGGDQAFINISVPRSPGVLTMIVDVLERHSVDVVTVQISSDQSRSLFTIHTRVDRERGMFMDTATSEEIHQLAVSEMMLPHLPAAAENEIDDVVYVDARTGKRKVRDRKEAGAS
uniref:Plant bHLH transcription factor ACT-like domain-containing protein n=1 Tax=Oryza brachyantha TaxID=4533 RepID=J3LDN7_ORYBR